MNKNWKKEVARDIIALGSLPFYAIVMARMLITPELSPLIPQLLIALGVLVTLDMFLSYNHHLARGLVIVVFTSLGYSDQLFWVFAGSIWIGMAYALFYLKEKKNAILNGALAGAISSILAYYLTNLLI
jgi:hypothetical protein